MNRENHNSSSLESRVEADLLVSFAEEAREHLDQIEPDLLALEGGEAEAVQAALNRVMRAVHSIKGAAALVGLTELKDFSHLVENVLTRLRQGSLDAGPEAVDTLLLAVDRLRRMIGQPPQEHRVPASEELPGLYALQEAAPAPARRQASASEGQPSGLVTVRGGASEVLVVEDNQLTSRLLCQRIAEDTAFAPVPAFTLAEARRLLESGRRFFVGVLDLNLPDAPDGEVVDLALGHGLAPIILTATFNDQVRERILAKNVVDYVVKGGPRDLEYVTRLINRLSRNLAVNILVVDDTRPIRELVAGLLRLQGYQTLTASNGREALDVYAVHPDLSMVITDYQMPVMDGLELVGRLRGLASRDHLAIIGISAESSPSLPARFLKAGANDFLPKPFQNEEFQGRVNLNVELLELIKRLEESSRRDYLTGLFSRRWFFEAGRGILERQGELGEGLALGLIDIDHFKLINDTHGHAAGDQALKQLARIMERLFPEPSLVARLGGEEFGVLAPGLDRPATLVAFNQLRRQVERTPVLTGVAGFGMTISSGVVTSARGNLDQMLTRADELLYQAKNNGRNRVVLE